MKNLKLKGGVAGRYLLEAVRPDGTKRVVADWFDNLITDDGLNRLGTGGAFDRCHVGSGSTAPAPTDTGLVSLVGTKVSMTAATYGHQSSAPYFGWYRGRWRFNPGEADGNLSELGVGTASVLFSRALIKDGLGDPTTITILPEEYLDVTYEARIYPPLDDATMTVDIGGISTDVTVRACDVDSSAWEPSYLAPFGATLGLSAAAYNGTIGTITDNPSGSGAGFTSITQQAYVDDSLETTIELFAGLDAANLAGGISAIRFGQQTLGMFQAEFDPPIAKDNTKTLMLPVTLSWARKT